MRYALLVLLLFFPCFTLAEATKNQDIVETTIFKTETFMSEDADIKKLNDVNTLIANNDKDGALALLNPILSQCESSIAASDKKIIYVFNVAEFLEYVAIMKSKEDVIWKKDLCPDAYKTAAFIYVAANDKEKAFKYLDKAIEIAPFWADPHTERGYLLGQQGDLAAALMEYEKAIELADKYKTSAPVKPLALRGLGFILIEMNELDRAETAFKESLKLEPNNKLAENELEYIRQLQAKK
jgi:tetratricopeptide (TPR) repeat protein